MLAYVSFFPSRAHARKVRINQLSLFFCQKRNFLFPTVLNSVFICHMLRFVLGFFCTFLHVVDVFSIDFYCPQSKNPDSFKGDGTHI